MITKQGINSIDKEIREEYVDEKSNIKVDPLAKKGVSDLLVRLTLKLALKWIKWI